MRLGAARFGIAVLLVLSVSACGETDISGEVDNAGAAPTTEEGVATSTSTQGMEVAYASDLDANDIADQFGVRAAGAELITLTEDSAVAAGLNNENFAIGNMDVTAAIKAIQGGVPLKIVYVAQTTPEFVMVSQGDITSFDQLAGKTVAYHSPGSLTEIVQRELVRQHDPELEDKIKWSVLPESPNRASAMAAGRIHATSLEFLDVAALQEQGEFNILGDWGDLTGESGDALATTWVVSEDYLAQNREQVVAFLRHIQDGYDQAFASKDDWLSLATELLPDANADQLAEAYDYYVEVGMYPNSGEPPLTPERWAGLDEFFRQIGEYDQTASPDMVDFELVAEVANS